MIKNIAYTVSGLAGIIFGCTLLDNGLYMAIGGGCTLIICGIYIGWNGIRGIINEKTKDNKEEDRSGKAPTHPVKKKKKKNPNKKR